MRRTAIAFLVAVVLAVSAATRPAACSEGKDESAVAGLAAADPTRRLRALALLSGRVDAATETALVDVLTDPARPELHFLAAGHLAAFPKRSGAANAALEAAWESGDPAVRLAAGCALGRLTPGNGPTDEIGRPSPGAPVLDITPPEAPLEPPKSLDPADLDGTTWTACGPSNVIGEGTTTILFLRALPAGAAPAANAPARPAMTVVHAATADRSLDRSLGPDGKRQHVWTNAWRFESWTIAAGVRTRIEATPRAAQNGSGWTVETPADSIAIVGGALVAPALVRQEARVWTCRLRSSKWSLRFDADLKAGARGTAEGTRFTRARNAPEDKDDDAQTQKLDWEVDDRADAPMLRLHTPLRDGEVLPKNVYPARPTHPFAAVLDLERGTGAVGDSSFGSGDSYTLIARRELR